FIKGDKIICVIDYGDGECDNIATKTVGDKIIEINLDEMGCKGKDYKKGKDDKKGKDGYTKNVVKELVYLDDCDYPVAGTIQFIKGDKIICVIDYGDGECDNIATKTVGDKVYEFELDGKKKSDKKK
ncbi:hypothetical protein ACFLSQ_03165, partial [Bacteroidota bacterium]